MSRSDAPSVEASIVIPAWRLPQALDRCLTALAAQSPDVSFETIVVVNGGAAAVVQTAAEHPLSPVVVPLVANVGFGAACNIGAARARGEFVVFLNDDAEPEPGWLTALVSTAREQRAQLVASVLLDGDGVVAEAGARVLATGGTRPFGTGLAVSDAEDRGLLTTRTIDYGSGAGLLVSAALFESLGGFDPAYSPAYYEDVDLQWRARERGVAVWLSGAARIRHRSGLSTSNLQLFRQFASERTRAVFTSRWGDVLAEAPLHAEATSDPAPIPLRDRPPAPGSDVSDDPAVVLAAAAGVQAAFATWLEAMVHAANARAITAESQRDALRAERDGLRARLGLHTAHDPLESLVSRLQAAAPHILPGSLAAYAMRAGTLTGNDLASFASILVTDLVDAARTAAVRASCWLLSVAVLGRFPTDSEFDDISRAVRRGPADRATVLLLKMALADRDAATRPHLRVVTDRVVVEVDYSAQSDHHTGIQRVVRETVPLWAEKHDLVLVAWTASGTALRSLTALESDRVLRFAAHDEAGSGADDDAEATEIVVPFGTRILFPDVPVARNAAVVRSLAVHGCNRLGHIGYDLIPITSADLRGELEPVNTAQLISVIKHSERVAGISVSATSEFAGLVATLPAQGLTGPSVAEVTLPAVANPLPPGPDADRVAERPVVLLVGTRELHKNQRAVLQAAELLWREGLDFEVRQVGGPGSDDATFRAAADALLAAGRPLTVLGRVTEQRLWDEQRTADVAVFVSLHEGYGLPVAEALSVGTPVITTRYGSQAEVASDGGCLVVDPRSDADIADALRRVITQPELRRELAAQAAGRPQRDWSSYASRLWTYLVEGSR